MVGGAHSEYSHSKRRLGPQQHAEDLLARPQLDRLEDARGRQLDLLGRVAHVAAEPRQLSASEEEVLARDQVSRRDEVLRRGDDHLAVARSDEVRVHAHQAERLGARLLRLRQVQVHLVAVEIGVVRRADALVEAEGAPGLSLYLVYH